MKNLILLFSLCFLAQAQPVNLVQNGGFDRNIEDWEFTGNLDVVYNPRMSDNSDLVIQMHPSTAEPHAVLMQWISTVPGRTYDCGLNVVFHSDVITTLQRVEFSIIGRTNWSTMLWSQPDWTNHFNNCFSNIWTADSERTLLQIRDVSLIGFPALCFIDNVHVIETTVPIPTVAELVTNAPPVKPAFYFDY